MRHIESIQNFLEVLFLRDEIFLIWAVPIDYHSQEPANWSVVLALKFLIELVLEIVQMVSVIRRYHLIVHMDHEDDLELPLLSDIQTGIRLCGFKSTLFEPSVDFLIRVLRRLSKTIKRFVEFENFVAIACNPLEDKRRFCRLD